MAGYKTFGRQQSNRTTRTLSDLPFSVLLHIAELVPCRDLPSLICTCKELSGMANSFYAGRRVLDMRCFVKVSPKLCKQLIHRFSAAPLEKCFFKCDYLWPDTDRGEEEPAVYGHDDKQLIIERFLDNYCCDGELLTDLGRRLSSDVDWLGCSCRPIDVLAHCHNLDLFLSSHRCLRELNLDVEFSVFRVPKHKGFRQHWHLMQPFLGLQVIQIKCPQLEAYHASEVRYQSSTLDLQHLQLRFLQHIKKLKVCGIKFGLDRISLENYQHIKGPLALEKAVFLLDRWCMSAKERLLCYVHMRSLALKMKNVKTVTLIFNTRNSLRHCFELSTTCPV